MKKTERLTITLAWRTFRVLLLLVVALPAQAQGPLQGMPFLHPEPFNAARVQADDQDRAERGDLPLYGRSLSLMANSQDQGAWSVENGERIWRAGISSPGAWALELFLDSVQVPAEATMRLWSTEGEPLSEAFPMTLPAGVAELSTPLAIGDACILEYREPAHAAVQGRFRVAQVGHAYRDVARSVDEGPCHINVACVPESNGWEGPIRATVRISVVTPQGSGWCTGTLVNNVRQDCAPYILTAWHCGRTSTTAQFNQYKFYFNFQYATCSGGAYSTAQYITGAQLKAYSDDYAPQYQGVGGSDFMLLRTNAEVPTAFAPYWAGWDATDISTVTADGVCIHHPGGSPKRISTFTQTVTTGHPMTSSGLLSHYRMKWAPTANGFGVTEMGSSGSGSFKPNATLGPLLIGTLTGSSSGMSCTNTGGTAYFGKMSYHWTNNPNTPVQKLNHWLDPDNTGTLLLGGSADPCGTVSAVGERSPLNAPDLFPNPANDQLFIRTGIQGTFHYRILDATGRVVRTGQATGPNATLDMTSLPNGPYLLRIPSIEHLPATPFLVAH